MQEGGIMLVACLGELTYIKNEDLHTISYSKYCTDLSYAAPTWVNAVLVENIDKAVQRIREETQIWLSKELKEKAYVVRFEDFTFKIWYNKVVDGRFALCQWDSDRKIYSLNN